MIRCLLFMGILQNLDKQEKKVWTFQIVRGEREFLEKKMLHWVLNFFLIEI